MRCSEELSALMVSKWVHFLNVRLFLRPSWAKFSVLCLLSWAVKSTHFNHSAIKMQSEVCEHGKNCVTRRKSDISKKCVFYDNDFYDNDN